MAYVGTARRFGSSRDTLASIIQGEAGGEGLRGMQAVGGVISNRAATNFSGYGRDPVSQATARMQFQGQSNRPGAQAYSVADDVLAGRNPDPTGGALYYANPGDSSARWARNLNEGNATRIGNHYFTDNTRGVPFSGQSTNGVVASSDGQTAAAGGRVSAGGTDGVDLNGATRNSDGTYTTKDGDTTLPEVGDDATNKSVTGTQSGEQAKGQAQQQQQSGQSQNSGRGSGGSGFGVFMTDVGRAIGNALAPATQQSGQVQAQATEKLAQSTETSGTTIAKGSTDAAEALVKQSIASNTLFSDLSKDYAGRIFIVLLGIVFVGGGVAMFVFNKNPVAIAGKVAKKLT